MSSTYGERLKLSVFGQSHGTGIGMVLDGIPAGLPVDEQKLQAFLDRRAPGNSKHSTSRKEPDVPEFLGGIVDNRTCGAPIAAVIRNTNTRPSDYDQFKNCPRPGHADYTAQVKYRGFQDASGGGHFSGRLTAAICIAGGLCIQWLAEKGIQIGAHLVRCAGIDDLPFNPVSPQLDLVSTDLPVIDNQAGDKMAAAIATARANGDSVGGVIECAVTGLPAGIGEPMFGGMESRIAQIIYGIPGIKGLEFGSGFSASDCFGSENNDAFYIDSGVVCTETNHCGGILGGITNGMPLILRAAVKPTPSIARPQKSVDLAEGKEATLCIQGRHDPCIAPRAVPVIEAAVALAVFDAMI